MPSLSLDVPVELIKDPSSWTVEDIGIWLTWLGIREHVEAFAARGIDGSALLRLGAESAWADLGVTDPAQQRVLDSAVEPLKGFQEVDGSESSFVLHAVEGPIAGEVVVVGAGGITGGRHSASNGIVLSENYVSRRHFQITRDRAGQHLLQDVGSTTGTFLMVREELPLENLMVLQLGTTELTVYIEEDVCTLVATEGPDKDARATVQSQGLTIGREPSQGLCIRDHQISAFHCEVRHDPERGYTLDDRYSTNRTWLRLAPDGQPSKRFVLRVGDIFKVGSTLFHVIDPTVMPEAVAPVATSAVISSDESRPPPRPLSQASSAFNEDLGQETLSVAQMMSSARSFSGTADQEQEDLGDDAPFEDQGSIGRPDSSPAPPGLRWEPFVEGEARPSLSAEEYARQVTESRRQMHVQRRGSPRTPSQVSVVQQRELSSLQQGMRNSRAHSAYTLQQQRSSERRDEDLCKICYDKDIDVVLYPCGHFILCRWCAYKVSDCPVCRLVITHVIRTYKG
mmetsp:Transcript_60313/g.168489  ORF Transcript_60313/g.168489 Transcript_60313/m.168489 type:complete len:511 (+) Transcript_60313:42-1574(+)